MDTVPMDCTYLVSKKKRHPMSVPGTSKHILSVSEEVNTKSLFRVKRSKKVGDNFYVGVGV